MPRIALVGTADTKLSELLFLRSQILSRDPRATVVFIDVGRRPTGHAAIDISQPELLKFSVTANVTITTEEDLQKLPRGELSDVVSKLATAYIQSSLADASGTGETIHAIVAAGGSGNTSVAAAVMHACPVGLPKLIVSTVASGDVSQIIGESDVSLMYSVVDIAGLNSLLRDVLSNAAAAIVGMAQSFEQRNTLKSSSHKRAPQIGITMFGVTTPCVDAARKRLEESGAETYVFHATGAGGRAMERLVQEGFLDAVLDLTTTEICDLLMGGNMSAGPGRLQSAAERGIPCIVSVGACDMVNFGAKDTIPQAFQKRQLLVHNSLVTLMRTNKEECEAVGRWIAQKLKTYARDRSVLEVWLPAGGISMLAVPEGPFYNVEADSALFDTIRSELEGTGIRVVLDRRSINDGEYAAAVAERLLELMQNRHQL